MILQLTREDWEKAGPYSDALSCPITTAVKRILKIDYPISFMWTGIDVVGGDRIGTISPRFTGHQYKEAALKYNAGEQILFETSLQVRPQFNLELL